MRLKIDKKSEALYFRVHESEIVESEEVRPNMILDYDKNGRVVGIELTDLDLKKNGGTTRREHTAETAAEFEAIIKALIVAMQSAGKSMQRDQEEIERLKVETRAILAQLQAA